MIVVRINPRRSFTLQSFQALFAEQITKAVEIVVPKLIRHDQQDQSRANSPGLGRCSLFRADEARRY
jgi:hypothetical protein